MHIRKKIAGAAAALTLALSGGVVANVALAPDAEAAVNKVCHRGQVLDPPIEVLEVDGSKYRLYPGTTAKSCTPGDVRIFGFRPVAGSALSYYQSGSTKLRRAYYTPRQWTATLNLNITVVNSWYQYDD